MIFPGFLLIVFGINAVQLTKHSSFNTPSWIPCMCQNGRDGRDGRDGLSLQGPPGRDGMDGRDCVECARGPMGPKGERGSVGMKGLNGKVGMKGEKGNKGATGSIGAQGKPGEKGNKGDKGICNEEELSQLRNDVSYLKKEIDRLKHETVKVDNTNKIKQSLLPGGYSDHSVYDLQWHSMHMAAAAACRGLTKSGGSGCCENYVYPRSKDTTCSEICKKNANAVCDGELSIVGNTAKVKSSKDAVGYFYNYGCEFKLNYSQFETGMKSENIMQSGYISYCCCRK